ncbi:hypothetical protein Btru_023266 [Bulinus truncatus]|nr:hypothetical protein Btru_023266 [Bulinus truncatus]
MTCTSNIDDQLCVKAVGSNHSDGSYVSLLPSYCHSYDGKLWKVADLFISPRVQMSTISGCGVGVWVERKRVWSDVSTAGNSGEGWMAAVGTLHRGGQRENIKLKASPFYFINNNGDKYADASFSNEDRAKNRSAGRHPRNRTPRDKNMPDKGATIAGFVSQGATIAGFVSQGATIAGYVSQDAAIAGFVSQGATIAGYVSRGATIAGYVSRGATIAGYVSQGATIAGKVSQGATIAGYVTQCDTIAGYISQGATIDSYVSQGATIAGYVSRGATIAGYVSQGASIAGYVSRGATISGYVSRGATIASFGSDKTNDHIHNVLNKIN